MRHTDDENERTGHEQLEHLLSEAFRARAGSVGGPVPPMSEGPNFYGPEQYGSDPYGTDQYGPDDYGPARPVRRSRAGW